MNITSIGEIAKNIKPKKPTTKAKCEHQDMMGLVKQEGWTGGRWAGAWGRLIKDSRIGFNDLERLIGIANNLKGFSPRGFVRNRLNDRDWIQYFYGNNKK